MKLNLLAFSFLSYLHFKGTETRNCQRCSVGVVYLGKITKNSKRQTQTVPHFLGIMNGLFIIQGWTYLVQEGLSCNCDASLGTQRCLFESGLTQAPSWRESLRAGRSVVVSRLGSARDGHVHHSPTAKWLYRLSVNVPVTQHL